MDFNKQILALIAVLVAGILTGYLIGSSNSVQNKVSTVPDINDTNQKSRKSAPISEVGDKVIKFINANLLKPGIVAELAGSYETDSFYAFNLEFLVDNQPAGNDTVYATKDGKYLILKLYELPEETGTEQTKAGVESQDIDIENEPFKGDENAKITIIEFSGYSCPFCARFALETLPKIMNNFSVKVVFKDFPVHGEVTAHEAANCALEQGKYWEYHDMLFERQKEWVNNASKLYDYARILGLDVEEFDACVSSGKYRDEVMADKEEGVKLGVTGTPTFFINGRKVVGALPYEEFERILKEI
jgi:protein-disulfide isomerase